MLKNTLNIDTSKSIPSINLLFSTVFFYSLIFFTCNIYSGPRRIEGPPKRPEGGVQRCIWHHHHHCEDRGAEESVQRAPGGAAPTDVLRLCPDRSVRHHEAALRPRSREYVHSDQHRTPGKPSTSFSHENTLK